jgi:hypothetical protein
MKTFALKHGLYERHPATPKVTEDEDIPDELRTLLHQANEDTYANGFFRFVAADTFRPYLLVWELDPARCHPFIKCAFGNLIFYHYDQMKYSVLNPVYNCIDTIGEKDELAFVMEVLLCDRHGLESSFFLDVYEQAFERLGSPQPAEVYAFLPALGLGGSRSAEKVQKVNMREQMMILSSL